MPPISGKLYQKVLRVHYTSLEWNSPHIPSPQLPHPEDYGWKWDNQHQMYDAIMPTLLPAPEFIIKLTVCRCKTGCNTNWFKCLKNGELKCTEMCKCYNCKNVESDDFLNLRDHVIEEHTEFESRTIILLSRHYLWCDNKFLENDRSFLRSNKSEHVYQP